MRINLKKQLALLSLIGLAIVTHAQTVVTGPLNTTINNGNYINYNNGSIILKNGFTSTPGSGQSLWLHIVNTNCIPINLSLSTTKNYILTSIPRVAGVTNFTSETTCRLMQTVQYIDGLGRPLQSIQVHGSPNLKDVVQPMAYDQYGREITKYLPYADSLLTYGAYRANAFIDQAGFYKNPNSGVGINYYPTTTTVPEASPLNRPLEQGFPGATWQPGSGHTVGASYAVNSGSEVKLWTVNSGGGGAAWGTSYYTAGKLYKNTTTDENGHHTITFTDMQGRVICKKVQSGSSSYLETNYVYDDYNNLAYVIPPVNGTYPTTFTESSTVFNQFIYGYHYDDRDRLVRKKIPGKGWEYMVYNKTDQLVASQDSNRKAVNEWLFTKYDGQGRTIISGVWNNNNVAIDYTALQIILNGETILWETPVNSGNGYTNNAWPKTYVTTTLSLNYYDGYSNIPGLPGAYSAPGGASSQTQSLPTATLTNVLGTGDMLWTVMYYDSYGRNIKSYTQHYLGGHASYSTGNYDAIVNTYDFTNAVTATTRAHFVSSSNMVTVANNYTYDHVGRKLQTQQQINSGTNTILSQVAYNEVGQLQNKQLHKTSTDANFLQKVTYAYNERGWLRTSKSPLLNIDLRYNTADTAIQQYNGNIAEMRYSTPHTSKGFGYRYDEMNRLKVASAGSGNALNEGLRYDNVGNITALTRNGQGYGTLDYTYTGNRLDAVTGTGFASRSYTYDGNGNANSDGYTKMITYNLLNLPQTLTVGLSPIATYTYDAGGSKLRNTSVADSTWDYVNGIVYRDGILAYIITEEGRAIYNGSTYSYQYDLKDQLGSNRVVFDKGPTGIARELQEDEYYAFGLRTNVFGSTNSNRYLYNGKEIQTDLTNQYDYGARLYDPIIGRWTTIDPLAEVSRRWSPYNYGMNNPINMIDPDGMLPRPDHELLIEDMADYNAGEADKAAGWTSNRCCDGPSTLTGSILGDLAQSAIDGVSSTVFTYSSLIQSMVTGSTPNQYSFDYSNGERTFVSTPIKTIIGGGKAILGGALDLAAVWPAGGPAAGIFAKTPGVASSAASIIKDASTVEKSVVSLESQAKNISGTLNGGKNSVTIGTVDKQIRYDLAGKAHGGISTPHSQTYNKNMVNGEVKSVSRANKQATPMSQQEIRAVRKFLEKTQ